MGATIVPDAASGPYPEGLGRALLALRESGGEHFDPPRFRYIEAMLERAARHGGTLASGLLVRAGAALETYQQGLLAAREGASQLVARRGEQFPHAATSLQQLLAAGKLAELQCLASNLRLRDRQRPLGELLERLQRQPRGAENSSAVGLEQLLRQQEQQALAATSLEGSDITPSHSAGVRDLQAAGGLRKSRAQRRTQELLTRALDGCPENSGPLNPEMLAIRSLEALRALSPSYLQQMINYLDTVFALEASRPASLGQGSGGKRGSGRRGSRT